MNPNVKAGLQFAFSLAMLGFLAWLVWLLVTRGNSMDSEVASVLRTVVANIIPIVSAAAGFWLGTSLSSSGKDSTIATMSTPK